MMVRLYRVCVAALANVSPPDHEVSSADETRWGSHGEISRQPYRAQAVTTKCEGMWFFQWRETLDVYVPVSNITVALLFFLFALAIIR